MRQAIVFCSVATAFLLIGGIAWYASSVLLLLFACILLAVFFHHAGLYLGKWLHLSSGYALALAISLIFGLVFLAAWLAAPQISAQAQDLTAALPDGLERVRRALAEYGVMKQLTASDTSASGLLSQFSSLLPRARSLFTGFLGVIGNTAIIIVVAIYLAAQPQLYIRGVVMLLPHSKRIRARKVLKELGSALGQWLAGKLISMTCVGVFATVGLYFLDIPLALVLGLLAGLLDFIPYLGPVLAGVSAVLIAFTASPTAALHVTLLFVAIQSVESYLITPLVDRKMVSLPPAMTIMMQVLLGSLFGLIGIALATPLAVVIAVLVVMLYMQDVLHDPVKTPAEN